MAIQINPVITMKMEGEANTHALTKMKVRDFSISTDEPVERGGTNTAPSPTETMLASLIGCTNVITQKIVTKHGIDVLRLKIVATAQFDRRGVSLEEEIRVPFPEIDLNIELTTHGDDVDVTVLQTNLSKYWPISKILRESGTNVNENWTINHL